MKKLIVISFLIVLLIQAGGAWMCLKIQQFIAQLEMERDIDGMETCSEKISISLKEYATNKINDKEIFIKGKLYDIKSVNFSKGVAELLVVNDTKEEKILENIKKLAESNHQHGKNLPYHFLNLTALYYIYSESPGTSLLLIFLRTLFQSYCESITSHYPGILSPPPKLGNYHI